jgi:hypothetical protein
VQQSGIVCYGVFIGLLRMVLVVRMMVGGFGSRRSSSRIGILLPIGIIRLGPTDIESEKNNESIHYSFIFTNHLKKYLIFGSRPCVI